MKITFLGGAGTVTGSKFLVTDQDIQIMIDCGLFQGLKQLRQLNWENIPVDPKNLKAVILTHAHLDHCGYLPLLVKHGFKGIIYGTAPTLDLARIILLDSAHIQTEDAEYANKKGFSKHHPALPLYDIHDVEKCFPLFKTVPLNEKLTIGSLGIELISGGHILGASSVKITDSKISLYFSGDLGKYTDPLMPAPTSPPQADFIVMESTYGDRHHSTETSTNTLAKYINQVEQDKSVLLIPAFAVGRAQNLIYEIVRLRQNNLISKTIPVYFNSPMGEDVWRLYEKFSTFQKIAKESFNEFSSQVRFVKTAEQSRDLNLQKGPMIIIAASGMLTGGRVLHHLKAFADDSKNVILLAGFQAMGTRGWSLVNGQKKIKLHGVYLNIRAEIVNSDSFSAHADQDELLLWLKSAQCKPRTIFLVHGEPKASEELRLKIEETLHFPVRVPNLHDSYDLVQTAVRTTSLQI